MVLVHENGLARSLAAAVAARGAPRPLLVLTGHDHRQHVDRYGKMVVVIDAGTVGAGGVFGVHSESVGVAQLHFRGAGPVPRAVDLITVEPVSGAARADRIVVGSSTACEREACAVPLKAAQPMSAA